MTYISTGYSIARKELGGGGHDLDDNVHYEQRALASEALPSRDHAEERGEELGHYPANVRIATGEGSTASMSGGRPAAASRSSRSSPRPEPRSARSEQPQHSRLVTEADTRRRKSRPQRHVSASPHATQVNT
eukprot:1720841-Rhodomonas_salina.3